MWEKCILNVLYKLIRMEEYFMLLNQLEVTNQRANKIVMDLITVNPTKTRELHL